MGTGAPKEDLKEGPKPTRRTATSKFVALQAAGVHTTTRGRKEAHLRVPADQNSTKIQRKKERTWGRERKQKREILGGPAEGRSGGGRGGLAEGGRSGALGGPGQGGPGQGVRERVRGEGEEGGNWGDSGRKFSPKIKSNWVGGVGVGSVKGGTQ